MDIRPIRTDRDHRAALAAIEACWGAAEGTEEGDKLDVLVALVEIYEARRWPIEIDKTFDPVDVLRYAIDELGHTQAELAEKVGLRYYTFVSQVESGLGRLPIETQGAWAAALGLEPGDFARTLLAWYEPELYRLLFGGMAGEGRATA